MVPDLSLFFDDANNVAPPLLAVLDVFANDTNAPLVHDGTLRSIRDETQAAWVKAGTVRAYIDERHDAYRDRVFPLLEPLGMRTALWADAKAFRYALVGGAAPSAMEKRAHHLLKEMGAGRVRIDQVYPIASGRALGPKEKTDQFAACVTEADAMAVVFSGGPAVVKLDGSGDRAATVRKWLDDVKPQLGPVLLVSSNPWAIDEWLTVRNMLPSDEWPLIEVSAPAPSDAINVSKHLDSLGRFIYKIAQSRGL